MNLDAACKATGFQKCEFEPDSDPCEKCDKPGLHLFYRRTDYWENEGEYFCAECVIAHAKEIATVRAIECSEGHR